MNLCSEEAKHPIINMHILLTVLCKFLEVLTRRICLTNQELLWLVIISLILVTSMFDSAVVL